MNTKWIVFVSFIAVLALALGGTAYFTQSHWRAWLGLAPDDAAQAAHKHGADNRVKVTSQARATLRLDVRKPDFRKTYSRTLTLPAKVIEPPSQGDRAVVAPLSGVVTQIAVGPGQILTPGQHQFTLRLTGENLQNNQSTLFETASKIEILKKQKQEYEKLGSAVPKIKLIELDYQRQLLQAKEKALRFDLAIHGFAAKQIDDAAVGKFVESVKIYAPTEQPATAKSIAKDPAKALWRNYEVEHIEVHLGDQVKIGDTLCVIGNHALLYLDGAVYRQEMPLIQKAITEQSKDDPPKIIVPGIDDESYSAEAAPKLLYLGHQFDPSSQTVSVFGELQNTPQIYKAGGKAYRFWRYRPGQKVDLQVPVHQFRDVFVLPLDAVAQEGGEWYVFRENGNAFDRIAVTVLYRDSQNAVIANDTSIEKRYQIAWNHAATLLRMLQVQQSAHQGGGHHGHMH